jgi:hypothetical protein
VPFVASISCSASLGAHSCFSLVVVAGNNKQITVSTCAPQTDFDANIEVRQNCGYSCVPFTRKDGCPQNGLATDVIWQSYVGYSYYIRVSGPVVGNYGIRAYTVPPPTSPTPPVSPPVAPQAPTPVAPTTPTAPVGPNSCPASDKCVSLAGLNGFKVKFQPVASLCVDYCTRRASIKLKLPGYSCGSCK